MPEPDDASLMEAMKLAVLARLGDGYEICGFEQSTDGDLYEVDVREKNRPRAKIEQVHVQQALLEKIISENLDMEHLQGKKPLPEQVRQQVAEEFGDGLGHLFESREE